MFGFFICATLADITSFLRVMNVIGDLLTFDRAQVLQTLHFFCIAFRCQMINFALCFCVTLSTNTHKKLLLILRLQAFCLAGLFSASVYMLFCSLYVRILPFSPPPALRMHEICHRENAVPGILISRGESPYLCSCSFERSAWFVGKTDGLPNSTVQDNTISRSAVLAFFDRGDTPLYIRSRQRHDP